MTLSFFLGICITIVVVTLLFCIVERTKLFPDVKDHDIINRKLQDRNHWGVIWRVVFLLFFVVLAICAVWTAKSYIYSDTISNARYHVLSHKGYLLGRQFHLSHGITTTSEGYPEEALWDTKEGVVKLDRKDSTLSIYQFCEPIYVRKNDNYCLQNVVIKEDVSSGFQLYKNDKLAYELEIKSCSHSFFDKFRSNDDPLANAQKLYISKVYDDKGSCIRDTSTFYGEIRHGYPLLEIIAHSPRIDVSMEMEQWFADCYLVRERIPLKGNVFGFDEEAPLRLMPGFSFFMQNGITINRKPCDFETTFIVHFKDYADKDKMIFFSGIGSHRSEEFQLSYPDNDSTMLLEFLQKDMRQLREKDGRMFITSSTDEVTEDGCEGGYLYNKFSRDKNFYHINALLRYKVGSSKEALSFSVMDLNNSLSAERRIYHCDEPFYIHSKNKADNSISWIFEITNLRETNPLKMHHIVWFVLLMLFAVTLRMATDVWFNLRSLSLFEYALYVVLFGLCIVRLILGWRVSTFVPLENITLPTYLKMRASIYDWTFVLIWMLPILVGIYAYVQALMERKGWDKTIEDTIHSRWELFCERTIHWMQRHKVFVGAKYLTEFSFVTTFYVLALLLLLLIGRLPISALERLCNIVLPTIIYFITDIWMEIRRVRLADPRYSTLERRMWHSVLLFGLLLVTDAGFTIVFLACLVLYEGVLKNLFNTKTRLRGWSRWKTYVISVASILIVYLILRFQGDIMISLFNHTGWWVCGLGSGVMALFCVIYANGKRKIYLLLAILSLSFAGLGAVDSLTSFKPYSFVVNKKAHMRYRAEIQQLKKGEKIDDLIQESNYDSGDIVYIMRSAHNQWFINQYIRAGQDMTDEGCSFRLQPHSNQGCTFTTQTTDLVVTRYIIAEHGEVVARRIMILWLLLIIIFIIENAMSKSINVVSIGGGLLIYTVSLLVYLSATNRIVFIGQDFPMISLQSRIAVLFPYLLFCIPLFRSVFVRQQRLADTDDLETDIKGLVFGALLGLLTLISIAGIEQKGKEQEASQFNVSTLISNVSEKVNLINEQFEAFQRDEENAKKIKKMRIADVWKAFIEDNKYADVYYKLLESEGAENQFFSSALQYFANKQAKKTDANQLLHLRRRGGICYLAVNKQHYFIPAIMEEELQWHGNLYAAYVDPNYTLYGLNNTNTTNLNENKDYEKNIFYRKGDRSIISNSAIRMIPNLPLSRFDADWIPGDKPLLLLQSMQGTGQQEYFSIESDTFEIRGTGKKNQIATSLEPGDVFSLNYKLNGKPSRTIYSGKLQEDGIKYIARNVWLNGHQRLFYPLGKQLMWTYHFANLVSASLGDSPNYRDSSIILSLDYDLCMGLYKISEIEAQKTRRSRAISDKVREKLEAFKELKNQTDSINLDMYYNAHENKIIVKEQSVKTTELRRVVERINKQLKLHAFAENPLTNAIDHILQRPYDFTVVAIDGDGHIRALFDYTQRHRVDPNNIMNLNKLISELYLDGSVSDERDLFGNKALQHIPMGPASSFKPIAYTAITSQEHLNWKSINLQVSDTDMAKARSKGSNTSNSGAQQFKYYGGLDIEAAKGENKHPVSIDTYGGYDATNYLYKSDNLYHSVIIMFGNQPIGHAKDIMRSADGLKPEIAFPAFTYKDREGIPGRKYAFDPEKWFDPQAGIIREENSILGEGLARNYRIEENANKFAHQAYENYYGGSSIMDYIYHYPSSSKGWSYAERGSQNTADRKHQPFIRKGFNQMLLGADPLQVTPLQMAINALRLAKLNRAENITTLLDGAACSNYEFFELGDGWDEHAYMTFVRDIVWTQMRKVAKIGGTTNTRRDTRFDAFTTQVEKGKYGRPYYLYCKTGTLADEREDAKNNRIKHLMVIITDRQLEKLQTVEDIKSVHYYVIYISFMGVERSEFSPYKFQPYIDQVMSSTTFNAYMNQSAK